MKNHTHLISPRFTSRKLDPPFYRDIVDVFEDRMLGWIINPAKQLIKTDPLSVAAITLTTNYFEGIEIYHSGLDSNKKSKAFFIRGFQRVFSMKNHSQAHQDYIAEALYSMLRCGFAHEAMFRSGINLSTARPEVMFITYPKIDGMLDTNKPLESVVINPSLFVEGIERHFATYIRTLKRGQDEILKKNFLRIIEIKWSLATPGRQIGMTEENFFSGSEPELDDVTKNHPNT